MTVKQSRNASVLNEFPVPPTFIPQNVPTPSNPPPSRPPSLPLPPIPGPSPLSEQDLVHITAAARSRRTSRLSTSSNSSSWRESVASLGSGSSHGGRNRTESVTSISAHSVRSHSSNGVPSVPPPPYATSRAVNDDHSKCPPRSMAMNPAILEDDESLSVSATEPPLTRTSLSDIPRATPSPLPFVSDESIPHDERISSIDMRDLPALQDDDTINPDHQAHTLHVQIRAARSKYPMHKSNIRPPVPQPRRKSSPTGGKNHRRTASATQHSRNREPSGGTGHLPTAFPSVALPDGSDRASSPDIATCIATTPRPRRRSRTSSTHSGSRSQSRRRAPKSLPGSSRTSAIGRSSIFSLPDEPSRRESEGSATLASRTLLAYVDKDDDGDSLWHDGSLVEDYGVLIKGGDGAFMGVPDDEDTAGDSDSSLDLHTPLPSLMLRDGVLSPYSKLLPQNIHADAPVDATDSSQHGSVSAMPKSGVLKDERDTIRRRVRHRDGRLLRGGIGLTTGLGWSDSEDEDAPSELTRRLSRLALSRMSSAPTAKTVRRTSRSHPHSLSRSYSGDAKVHSSKSAQNMRRPSHPPISWQKRNPTVVSTLSLSIPEHDSPEPVPSLARFSEPPSSRVDIHADSQPNDQVRTPSTSSTQSLPGPVTPDVTDILPHNAVVKSWDRDKSLPPLPLSRVPSLATLRPTGSLSDMKSRASRLGAPPSTRPISSGSELSDSTGMPPHSPKVAHGYTASTLPSTRTTPRPLHLSASLGTGLLPGEPASNQGLLLGYNRQLHDQQRVRVFSGQSPSASLSHRYSARKLGSMTIPGLPQSGSVDLSLSEMGELRLRPRTGTGMVYKKSSISLTRAAADVQAQSRIRMTSEKTSPVAS